MPTILSVILWGDLEEELIFRTLGVAGILDGAITILIPILHRLSHDDFADRGKTLVELDEEIASVRARLQELEQAKQRLLAVETPSAPVQSGTSSRSNSAPTWNDSGMGPSV